MGSIVKGRKYRLGDVTHYQSIYGYPKDRYWIIDAETGSSVGEVKQEKVPGTPGQPEIFVYYTRSIEKPHGALRFYQSPEALVIALGGVMDESALSQTLAPNPGEKAVIKKADETLTNGDPIKADTFEERLAKIEATIANLGPKPRRKPGAKKDAKKSARKPAAKSRVTKPVGRKVKTAL